MQVVEAAWLGRCGATRRFCNILPVAMRSTPRYTESSTSGARWVVLARKGPTEVLSACAAPHDAGKNGWNGIQRTDGRPKRARCGQKTNPFACLAFPILTDLKIPQNAGFWSRIDDEFFGAKRSMHEPNPVVQPLLATADTGSPRFI